jgi:hypothetical protein
MERGSIRVTSPHSGLREIAQRCFPEYAGSNYILTPVLRNYDAISPTGTGSRIVGYNLDTHSVTHPINGLVVVHGDFICVELRVNNKSQKEPFNSAIYFHCTRENLRYLLMNKGGSHEHNLQ